MFNLFNFFLKILQIFLMKSNIILWNETLKMNYTWIILYLIFLSLMYVFLNSARKTTLEKMHL